MVEFIVLSLDFSEKFSFFLSEIKLILFLSKIEFIILLSELELIMMLSGKFFFQKLS